jgi:hypothetical protein
VFSERAKEENLPNAWSHKIEQGAFKIEPVAISGSVIFRLWFEDKDLGLFQSASTAARSISERDHDDKLGFCASSRAIPLIEWKEIK